MDNIEIIEMVNPYTNETIEHVIINRGNGEFTTMLKSTYDEMIAKQNEVNSDKI